MGSFLCRTESALPEEIFPADAGSLHGQVNGVEFGQAIGHGDGFGFNVHGCRFQAVAFGGDGDRAGGKGGADGDAVDAALGVEVEVVGGVGFAGVVAAAPVGGAGAGEIDAGVVGGAAPALGVNDFKVDEGGVLAVGAAGRRGRS